MRAKSKRLRHRLVWVSLTLAVILGPPGIFECEIRSGTRATAPLRSNTGGAIETPHQYTGPGSCSSTTCHGSIVPRTDNRVKQNEYSIWIVSDKHSKAYAALTGTIGERMATILKLGKPGNAPQCLACHALDVPVAERARTFDLSEGVSCESCHGPAAAWLGPHTERDWTHEESVAKLGMYDTRDLTKRTEKCLSCHLGNDRKFVDHEMIAAGHPDLYFELDSFSAQCRVTGRKPGEPGRSPENRIRGTTFASWTTGQAVQLSQSLLHLADRARKAKSGPNIRSWNATRAITA